MLETIGKDLNASNCYLWTKKEGWLHEWYKRCGYSDFKEHEQKEFVWMLKNLSNK